MREDKTKSCSPRGMRRCRRRRRRASRSRSRVSCHRAGVGTDQLDCMAADAVDAVAAKVAVASARLITAAVNNSARVKERA